MKRYGMVVGVAEDKVDEYKTLHAEVWPSVLKIISACHIQNYSIYFRELEPGAFYLFSYFEYVGDHFEADMNIMAADPETQKWWAVCVPCLKPLPSSPEGGVWANMEEVFHYD